MELKRYNKKKEKLNILFEILNQVDFEHGDTYTHPPMTDNPLPAEADTTYLRDRIYAIIRAEKHTLEMKGHYHMIHTLERFSISIQKDNRLKFIPKIGSRIYDSIKEPAVQQQDNTDTDWE